MAEEREIKLKHTKRRLEDGEEKKEPAKVYFEDESDPQPLTGEGNCGGWYFKWRGGHLYSCRICHTEGPTWYEYEECIQLPD